MNTGREQDILGQVEHLPRLPSPAPVIAALLRLAGRPGIGRDELLGLVGLDLGLACHLLRDAAARGLLSAAPTLEEAAQRMSQPQLLAVLQEISTAAPESSASAAGDLQDGQMPIPPDQGRMATRPLEEERPEDSLWGHAVATALGCRLLAQHLGRPAPETAYLAGLIHDLGKNALLAISRNYSRQIRFTAQRERLPYFEAERRCRVPQHTQLGHALACRWGLPRPLREVIFRHHEPSLLQRGEIDPQDSVLVDLVIVADGMARRLQLGNPFDPMGSPAWGALTRKRIGLERSELNTVSLKLGRAYQAVVMELFGRTTLPAEGLEDGAKE